MSQREEFVKLAEVEGVSMRELCRRFGISHVTGYKWLGRYRARGAEGLHDRPRRPHRSPGRTAAEVERALIAARDLHPSWGARKIRRWMVDQGQLPVAAMPAPSTITAIIRRNERIGPPQAGQQRGPYQRFEHDRPNQLWQMDFKGHFALANGGRCHPLTVLDDHSRYSVCLQACGDERAQTVKERLTTTFRVYGLPERILMDNGSPWGSDSHHPHTPLTVWLMRLGIGVVHSRPYHPQTQGKEERFHRTLKAEVLQGRTLQDLACCQREFDPWRYQYNHERPHQALDMATPASRYTLSPRTFPQQLPAIEYGPDDLVRRVQAQGEFFFQGKPYRVSKAFRGMPVALRATQIDGLWDIFLMTHKIGELDQHQPTRL